MSWSWDLNHNTLGGPIVPDITAHNPPVLTPVISSLYFWCWLTQLSLFILGTEPKSPLKRQDTSGTVPDSDCCEHDISGTSSLLAQTHTSRVNGLYLNTQRSKVKATVTLCLFSYWWTNLSTHTQHTEGQMFTCHGWTKTESHCIESYTCLNPVLKPMSYEIKCYTDFIFICFFILLNSVLFLQIRNNETNPDSSLIASQFLQNTVALIPEGMSWISNV